MENDCVIYGLRAKGTGHFFYVGCTQYGAKARLGQHLYEVRRGGHKNAAFTAMVTGIGLENVETVVIEAVSPGERFEREEFWIRSYRDEGHPLVNIVLTSDERTYFDPYRHKRLAWKGLQIFAPTKARTSEARESDLELARLLERLGVKLFKRLLDNGDEWLKFLGYPEAR